MPSSRSYPLYGFILVGSQSLRELQAGRWQGRVLERGYSYGKQTPANVGLRLAGPVLILLTMNVLDPSIDPSSPGPYLRLHP